MATQSTRFSERPRQIGRGWIEQRHARIAGAIAFLKTRGTLVSVVNRDDHVRRYFVTGYARQKLAEDVIDIAIAKGWSDL